MAKRDQNPQSCTHMTQKGANRARSRVSEKVEKIPDGLPVEKEKQKVRLRQHDS